MSVKLLEATEVAEVLSVPVSWVREHTRAGRIPHVQLGRYVRYDLDEVLAWVETQKSGGAVWRKYEPRPTARS